VGGQGGGFSPGRDGIITCHTTYHYLSLPPPSPLIPIITTIVVIIIIIIIIILILIIIIIVTKGIMTDEI
jgi:hypothetical protein